MVSVINSDFSLWIQRWLEDQLSYGYLNGYVNGRKKAQDNWEQFRADTANQRFSLVFKGRGESLLSATFSRDRSAAKIQSILQSIETLPYTYFQGCGRSPAVV